MRNFNIGRQATRLATLALLAGLGYSATAAFGADAPSVLVDARGLNLESREDIATLYSRLKFAAESVCGVMDARGYAPRHRALRCAEETLASVVAEIGTSQLRARHQAEVRMVRRSPDAVAPAATASASR